MKSFKRLAVMAVVCFVTVAMNAQVVGDTVVVNQKEAVVFEELMKSEEKEKITEKSFRDICKQVEGYGKPIGNLRAFVKRCLKNYFEGNIIRYSPKRNSFNDFQQNEYDFKELERAILSN